MLAFRTALAATVLLIAAGCSSQGGGSSPSSSPSPLRNPLRFPLYPQSTVVTSHAFTEDVEVRNPDTGASIFNAGNGTYEGHEVIASSGASFADLSAWADRLSASPPPGYTEAETGRNPDEEAQAQQYGIDYAAFKRKDGARTHGVLLVVMDPQRVDERFGRILGMIAKYRALPEAMRAPIDNAAKARIGMTITEATQPDSPIGAALAALGRFEHKDVRGIVVIDAVKR